jgi:predicted metal-dependent hydrolase
MFLPTLIITGSPSWAEAVTRRMDGAMATLRYDDVAPVDYITRLADDGAALILVNGDADDWRFYATSLRTSPATRRIPVVAVADKADVRAQADRANVQLAVASADLLGQLPGLLLGMARIMTPEARMQLDDQCADPLPDEGRHAIEKFNASEFFEQHELFEAMWRAEPGPVRNLYQGVLQVGVAYYQVQRGNASGALKMLLRSLQWLTPLPDVCRGIDVAALKADSARVRAELERLGPDGLDQLDRSLLRPVRFIEE